MSAVDRWPRWSSTTRVWCPREERETIHGHAGWIVCMNRRVEHERIDNSREVAA